MCTKAEEPPGAEGEAEARPGEGRVTWQRDMVPILIPMPTTVSTRITATILTLTVTLTGILPSHPKEEERCVEVREVEPDEVLERGGVLIDRH